jgi:hypothetical protein
MSTQAWSYRTVRTCARCGSIFEFSFDENADELRGRCLGPQCSESVYEGCTTFSIVGLLSSPHGGVYSAQTNRTLIRAVLAQRRRRTTFERDGSVWRQVWAAPSRVQIFQVTPTTQPVYFAALISDNDGAEPSTQRYATFDEAYLKTFQISFAEELRRNSL